MLDKRVLKTGAVAAIVGALLGIIGNLLHPRAEGYSTGEELRLVAQSEIWVLDHFLISIAIAISFIGLIIIAKSFLQQPAASWARVALSSAVLGSALGLVLIFIDGFGTSRAAQAWAANPTPAAEGAASAIIAVNLSLFTGLMFTLFGITPLLYGAAVLGSREYPKWLGYLAAFAGAVGIVSGSIQYLRGVTPLTANMLFPISSLSFSLWSLVMGWQLWKRSNAGLGPTEQAAG